MLLLIVQDLSEFPLRELIKSSTASFGSHEETDAAGRVILPIFTPSTRSVTIAGIVLLLYLLTGFF